MKNIYHNKKGMTLVEVLIYTAIFSLSITSLISYFLMVNAINIKNNVIINVENDSKFIFETIGKNIINSENIIYPLTGAASSTLILDMYNLENNLEFYLNNGILYVKEGNSSYALGSSYINMKNLEFFVSGDKSKNVKITFSLETSNGSSREYFYERQYYNSFSTR
ncbi:MAG: prepilin-type N-terminal cleavage/methylation domain-containing protein [Fusobacteriaceae bacterium]|nr:prepilin-type N-terminal cleavage/methylation domain-containing protein [Fusobacteriaceae bacterium]